MKAWENGGLSSVAGGKGNRGDHSEAPFLRQLLRLSSPALATPRGRHSAESWELKEGGENPDIRGGRGREKRSRQRWVEGGRALTRRRGDELLGLGPRAAGVQWGATETPVGRIKRFALFFRSPFSCSFIFFLLLFSNVSGALPARLTLCWARSFP